MELIQFSKKQIEVVERTAKQLSKLAGLRDEIDLEATYHSVQKDNPYLRSVSFREISDEVLFPGSFRK